MALVAANVLNGTTGAVYYDGTAAATLPTNPTSALDALLLAGELGYISEDGITKSIGSETTDIKAWQNGDVIDTIQTSHLVTIQFTMLETNPNTLEAYYGDGSYTDNGTYSTTLVRGDGVSRGIWVIQVVDGDDYFRVVIPDGKRTANADVQYQNGVPIGYGVTITCFPDTSSNKAYIYSAVHGAS